MLRRLQTGHSRVEMDRIRTSGVRGDDGLKELTFDYMGKEIRAAVVNGLGNADKLIKRIQSGEVSYDFVEVMACPGGYRNTPCPFDVASTSTSFFVTNASTRWWRSWAACTRHMSTSPPP